LKTPAEIIAYIFSHNGDCRCLTCPIKRECDETFSGFVIGFVEFPPDYDFSVPDEHELEAERKYNTILKPVEHLSNCGMGKR